MTFGCHGWAQALGLWTGLGQLGGRADIDLPFRADANGVTSSGTGRLTGATWGWATRR